jgi:uncharacterized protein
MFDVNSIYLLLFFLIILQSIAGVGLLVIGTPMLLIYNISFIEILSILLPISILTSFFNLIFLKLKKKKLNIKIDQKMNFLFFTVCLPFIFLGLYLIKNFNEFINFKYLVSFVIFFSLIIMNQKKILIKMNNNFRILFLSFIGLIHGISNTGGSLLSLFLTSNYNKNQSRYNITYFYFFLALFQFFIFLLLFNIEIKYINLLYISAILPIGIIIGNFLTKYIDDINFKVIINFLSATTCVILLIGA